MKGKPLSPEHKAAIAAGNRGRKHSDETKIKMSLVRRAMLKRRCQQEAKGRA